MNNDEEDENDEPQGLPALQREAIYDNTENFVRQLRQLSNSDNVTFCKHPDMKWRKPTIKKIYSMEKGEYIRVPAWKQPQDAIFPRMRADNNNPKIKNALIGRRNLIKDI